jgi:serine-type D-Ala-D-Ala carboxypeptidase/endopeptidase
LLAEAAAHEVGHTYVITNGDGGLMARIVGQNAFAIVESRKDHFYYTELQAFIEFVRRSGTVVGLVLTQHGQTFGIPKLDATGKPMVAEVLPQYPNIVTLDPATLASYAGTYDAGGSDMVVSVDNGHVFAQISGQTAIEIYPSAKDQFYYKLVDAQITFARSGSGNVESLTLQQNGRTSTWRKQS